MAEFRQLAIDFVLEDDKAKAAWIAQQAAKGIESAAADTKPVARWVESVQPWMPGSNGDDVMKDTDNTPDWTARAKGKTSLDFLRASGKLTSAALEFLSQTLVYLKPDTLKPSQIDLLVAFFGAMFEVDHKAGILASANALSRIIAMKSFHAKSGKEIIHKICQLKEDFSRQVSQTRLAVYRLLRSLIHEPEVVKDLRQRDGQDPVFMKELLQLCVNERDPDCLMVWFNVIRSFLSSYVASNEMLEEVFASFKAYFPITLPRTAQSGVTPEELKLQLRRCFSSTHQLAPLALPFLLGKLDQGDGVTVNVKLDILKTIRACLDGYDDVSKDSITPYTNRIWTSLKYEVRNGEIEDTIWASLEILKTLGTRLCGEDLRDYTLTVVRDCVADLATPMYATSAGRLLVSVMSAKPNTFVLTVAPAVTHIRECLRHPRSLTHSLDLLKILRIILETRLLLTEVLMSEQEKLDFAAVDGVFRSLYAEVYQNRLELAEKPDASEDDFSLSAEAIQGVGALIGQKEIKSVKSGEFVARTSALLLPPSSWSDSCDTLFRIATHSRNGFTRRKGADKLINESAKALHRIILAYPEGFPTLVAQGVDTLRRSIASPSHESLDTIRSLGPLLAYIGCSSISTCGSDTIRHFLDLAEAIVGELLAAMDRKASPRTWCLLLGGFHSAVRYLNDACAGGQAAVDEVPAAKSFEQIGTKYSRLAGFGVEDQVQSTPSFPVLRSATEIRSDALLISLFVERLLYRRATQPSQVGEQLLLSPDFDGSEPQYERRYLYLLSELASFTIRELNETQQASLEVERYSLDLFRSEDVDSTRSTSSWLWLTSGPLNILSLGILQALRPARVAKLYQSGIAQQILIDCTSSDVSPGDTISRPVMRSILAVLTNKHDVESLASVVPQLRHNLDSALTKSREDDSARAEASNLDTCLSLFALVAGILRRGSGQKAQPLLQALRSAPNVPSVGDRLGQGLEIIVAPQKIFAKENFAVVRPLWLQKFYLKHTKPMLEAALGHDPAVTDPCAKSNYSIAVLLLVRHMDFYVYEEDTEGIIRIAISIAQNFGAGAEALAALQVIRDILVKSPDKAQEHIRSLVDICTSVFMNRPSPRRGPPNRLTRNAGLNRRELETQTGCGKLALDIIGGLPRMFEPRRLIAYEPQVQRDLSTACGHRIRELRSRARFARGAWADVK